MVLAAPPLTVEGDGAELSADFEALRWFWLPAEIAAGAEGAAREPAPRSVPTG